MTAYILSRQLLHCHHQLMRYLLYNAHKRKLQLYRMPHDRIVSRRIQLDFLRFNKVTDYFYCTVFILCQLNYQTTNLMVVAWWMSRVSAVKLNYINVAGEKQEWNKRVKQVAWLRQNWRANKFKRNYHQIYFEDAISTLWVYFETFRRRLYFY